MKVRTSWDASKPLPQGAVYCDSFGTENSRGHYAMWRTANATETALDKIFANYSGGTLSKEESYIVKITKIHVRTKTFNYAYALKHPIDLSNNKLVRKLNAKINRIIARMGVNFVDRAGVVIPINAVSCAAWFCRGQKEGIGVNPYWILYSDAHLFSRLIKKEVIHKALYRNFRNLSNKKLLNFVLDVVSMRVIAQTPYNKIDKQTAKLAETLINPKIYKMFPVIALLDCSLTGDQAKRLPSNIYDIWKDLYGLDRNGFLPDLSKLEPATLYFRIKAVMPEDLLDLMETNAGFNSEAVKENGGNKVNYPFNISPSQETGDKDGSESGDTIKDDTLAPSGDSKTNRIEKAVKQSMIPRKDRMRDGFSNSMTKFWDNEVVEKKNTVDEKLQEFSKKWRTEKAIDSIASKIKEEVQRETVRIDPFPKDLTDTGIALWVAGISGDVIPYFFNHSPDVKENKRKIMAIFDVSPSMGPYFGYMAKIVETIEQDCDVTFALPKDENESEQETVRGAIAFAGDVIHLNDQDLEDMKTGKFKIGASTCFEELCRHMTEVVKSNAVDCCIVFTDGESSVAKETCEKFNETGKTMFRVYFGPEGRYVKDDDGNMKEEGTSPIRSPLDECKGESFTLHLPPADSVQ